MRSADTGGSWPSKPKTLPFEEPGSLRGDGRMTVKQLLERSERRSGSLREKGPAKASACGVWGGDSVAHAAQMSTKPTVRRDRAVLGFQ